MAEPRFSGRIFDSFYVYVVDACRFPKLLESPASCLSARRVFLIWALHFLIRFQTSKHTQRRHKHEKLCTIVALTRKGDAHHENGATEGNRRDAQAPVRANFCESTLTRLGWSGSWSICIVSILGRSNQPANCCSTRHLVPLALPLSVSFSSNMGSLKNFTERYI